MSNDVGNWIASLPQYQRVFLKVRDGGGISAVPGIAELEEVTEAEVKEFVRRACSEIKPGEMQPYEVDLCVWANS